MPVWLLSIALFGLLVPNGLFGPLVAQHSMVLNFIRRG